MAPASPWAHADGPPKWVAVSDAAMQLLEKVQHDLGEGPCLAAYAGSRMHATISPTRASGPPTSAIMTAPPNNAIGPTGRTTRPPTTPTRTCLRRTPNGMIWKPVR
jgi:hypothetical protein